MNFKLKPLVASMALVASGAALAAGFTPPEPAAVVERLELTRNHNGRFEQPNDWFRRIYMSGEINVDAIYSSRSWVTPNVVGVITDSNDNVISEFAVPGQIARFQSGAYSDVSLSDADLYFGAEVNDWVMANVDLIYNDGSEYSNVNQDHIRQGDGELSVDEAYITIANFRQSPFYLLAGQEYVPYGMYERHPITAPVTQLMTQTNETAVQVGVMSDMGFNASLFAFRNKVPRAGDAEVASATDSSGNTLTVASEKVHHRIKNGGVQAGFKRDSQNCGFNIDGSWLANINDVDYIARGESLLHDTSASNTVNHGTVGGYSLVAKGHYMGFDGELQYTAATKHFATQDVPWVTTTEGVASVKGAKPQAWLAGVGYSFQTYGMDSRFGFQYQGTRESKFVGFAGLPKNRYQGDYSISVLKNTAVTLEYVNDQDYGRDNGGTGKHVSTGVIRLSTRFA